jgi:general L-amino acid transport system substrate-binding protein
MGSSPTRAGATLDAVKKNGVVRCGVSPGVAFMSMPDSTGLWQGFDVEICRSVAAAVFGDADEVKYVPTTAQTRFTALQSGEVDLISRTTALTISRDSAMGLAGTTVSFYTGQGFLVHKKTGAKTGKDLDGATVCATQGSIIERNVEDFSRANNIKIGTIAFDTPANVLAAFMAGRCDAISNDMINLMANRLAAPNPNDLILLPDMVAKEMHGPMVRNGDPEWAQLVRWTVFALIQAEEYGLTRANVEKAKTDSTDPQIRRFLGLTENVGTGFGLPATWAFEVVRQIGNYGEMFERTAGKGGLGLGRGPNRLWTNGGLLISWLWQ